MGAIKPAVVRTANAPEKDRLKAAILANVEESVNDALEQSEILRHLLAAGTVTIVGAYYELESGRVTFSHPIGAAPGSHTTSHESGR